MKRAGFKPFVPTNCHFSYGKASQGQVELCLLVLIRVAQTQSCWQMVRSIGALVPFEGGHSVRTRVNQLRNPPFRRISWSRCHKGRPYNRFVGVYFRSNRSCRLSPTPPIMKMGLGDSRITPTGGYFQRNDRGSRLRSEYLMRVVTLTTWNEKGCGPEAGNHKGCPYEYRLAGSYFQRNDRCRGYSKVSLRRE